MAIFSILQEFDLVVSLTEHSFVNLQKVQANKFNKWEKLKLNMGSFN